MVLLVKCFWSELMRTINLAIVIMIIVLVLLCSCDNKNSKVISKETSTGMSISSSDTQSNSAYLTTGINDSQATTTTQTKTNTSRTTTTRRISQRTSATDTTTTEMPYNDPKVNETLGNTIGNILSNTRFCEINGYIYQVYANQGQPYSLVIKRIKNQPNEKWETVLNVPTQDLVGVYREMSDNYVQSFGNRIYFGDYSINSDGTDFKVDIPTGEIIKIGSRTWCYPVYTESMSQKQNNYRYEILGIKNEKYEDISEMPYSHVTDVYFAVNGWIYNGYAGLRVSYDLKTVQRISNSYPPLFEAETLTYADEWIYFRKNDSDYYRCRPNFSNIQFLFKEIGVCTRINVSNGIMYYGNGNDLISYNIGTKKRTKLCYVKDTGFSNPVCFGDYLYFNSCKISRINIKTLKYDLS